MPRHHGRRDGPHTGLNIVRGTRHRPCHRHHAWGLKIGSEHVILLRISESDPTSRAIAAGRCDLSCAAAARGIADRGQRILLSTAVR